MKEILERISSIIETYESGTWESSDNLRVMLRELSANIYYLTRHNIEYHVEHNAIQFKYQGSVSSGLILANEKVPELRHTRKIMLAAEKVCMSMTMELSILKNEA